jgi:hypothetical protein
MPVPRDDLVAALHLSLKPAFVLCTFLAGSNLAALPIFQLRPSILDQGHAHLVLDTMCQPSCDLLPCRTCRRNAWMATASHTTVDRQQLGRRLKGARCRSRQGRRHPRPVSLSPSGTSTSRPSHRSLLFNAHHPLFVMPEHQLRELGEPPFQAPISPSKCSTMCMCPPRDRCFARMSAAHVSSSFLHRPLSGLRAAVFLQGPVSVPPSCTPARVGRPQATTSPEPAHAGAVTGLPTLSPHVPSVCGSAFAL